MTNVRDLLGKQIRYIDSVGVEQYGILAGIVDEPCYVIAHPWSPEVTVITQSTTHDLALDEGGELS
jgi:hypothetical protein